MNIEKLTAAIADMQKESYEIGDAMTKSSMVVSGANGFEYRGGQARFTGWKFGWHVNFQDGFVAQWTWYELDSSNRGKNLFVNLPGLQLGMFEKRHHYDIGVERLSGDESPEYIRDLVEDGKQRLIKLVDLSIGTNGGESIKVEAA